MAGIGSIGLNQNQIRPQGVQTNQGPAQTQQQGGQQQQQGAGDGTQFGREVQEAGGAQGAQQQGQNQGAQLTQALSQGLQQVGQAEQTGDEQKTQQATQQLGPIWAQRDARSAENKTTGTMCYCYNDDYGRPQTLNWSC